MINKSFFIESISSIKQISKKDWENIIGMENPFIAYEFLLSLEESGCTNSNNGWIPNHLLIKLGKKVVGIIPNFIKYHSAGEYVFDQNWANAYFNLGLNYYPKFLSAVPFTPINGDRIFLNNSIKNLSDFLKTISDYLTKQDISSHHFNFISKLQSQIMEKSGFLTRLGIQYHWYNNNYKTFDDYLDSFKLKKRKNVLKEREYLNDQGIYFKIFKGEEISRNELDFFYKCYLNTIEKKWANQYLNLDFFKLILNSQIKRSIVLFIAYDNNSEPIASALNFEGKNILYGRYWGSIKQVKFLHFELCYYQSINYAIKNNFRMIESGAQGEHKISRGYKPTLTFSNHWIKIDKFRDALQKVLIHENNNVVETVNYLKKLLPFKNNN